MSPTTSSWIPALLSVAGLLAQVPTGADGHVYVMKPVSRNLFATTAFQESTYPGINYCPHCFQSRGPAAVRARGGDLPWPHFNGERAENGNYIESDEVAKRHGICGDPEQTAAEGSNRYGLENSNYPVLETYAQGEVLEVKIVVSTYHWGHVEAFICDAGDLPDGPEDSIVTQSCFNKYPLDRAANDDDAGPIDPAYPGRFFLDPPCRAAETDQTIIEGAFPGDVATVRYQLPQGLTCTRCTVQVVYYTGNSCKHQGYAEFDPVSWPGSCATTKADWINEGLGQCGDGDNYPEEFWNCSDIEITGDGSPAAPSPVPEAAPSTKAPVAAPVTTEDKPTTTETPAPLAASSTDGYKMPSPSPVEEPATATDAPAIARTASPTGSPVTVETFNQPVGVPTPAVECADPVEAYGQCGGDNYAGSTCCSIGYECNKLAECYSECRPIDDGCSESWGQCGGTNWDGPSCCHSAAECVEMTEDFHQCIPHASN